MNTQIPVTAAIPPGISLTAQDLQNLQQQILLQAQNNLQQQTAPTQQQQAAQQQQVVQQGAQKQFQAALTTQSQVNVSHCLLFKCESQMCINVIRLKYY